MRVELVERDYYLPTKLVGFISRRIKTETPQEKMYIRTIIALLLFSSLAFIPLTIIGVITGDYLLSSWQMILAFSWFAIAPVIIDLFEYAVDDFWMKFKKIAVLEDDEFQNLKIRMNKKIFSEKYLYLSIFFYAGMFAIMPFVLRDYNIFVLICVDILMIIAAIMWGIVGYLSLYINSFVREVIKIKIKINPFDPDGFGGLSAIGTLTLRVATLLSLASLYIPSGFQIASNSNILYLEYLMFAAITGLITVVITTFVTPLMPVSKLAKDIKSDLLRTVGDRLKGRLDNFEKGGTKVDEDIRTLVAFENYREIRDMKVWPLKTSTIFNIVCMIILPIILFILGVTI